MEVYDRREHAGVIIEIVHDDDPGRSPQDNYNAGTLYSWDRWFQSDEQISEPDRIIYVDETPDDDGYREDVSIERWFAYHYDAVLTIPLWYDEGRGGVARIYESDDPNCALVFTQAEIDKEFPARVPGCRPEYPGGVESAKIYAKARINELDQFLSGNVWGIVIREPSDEVEGEGTGFILDSCWGFIDEPDGEYIRSEADGMAEGAAEELQKEADEVAYWSARGMVTV